jgi:DNA polymerase III alpha subunit
MNINEYGAVFLEPEELFEHLYSGRIKNFQNTYITDQISITQFNTALNANKDSFGQLVNYQTPEENVEFFDEANQCDWFMPEDAGKFPIVDWLYQQCKTEKERNRVDEELTLFIQHGMFDLLFYLKYLVDTMREHKIVWGVGRGSSVASYVLFLIGVHKINSIKYNLDIKEFLK